MGWHGYQDMTNIEETMKLLVNEPGRFRIVAGGTDLVVQRHEVNGGAEPCTLLDVSRIEEMRTISESDDFLVIGASVTMAMLAASPLIRLKAYALALGAGWLGSLQIRNVATIGGNVVNGQPAADTSVPLVALGAEARILSAKGERYEAVEDLFYRAGESAVDPTRELITHFRFPVCEGLLQASSMQRLAKRKAFTLPQLSVAVRIALHERADRFERVRIVAAPVAPVPWRAKRAEESLMDQAVTAENIERAAALARQDANPRDSLRGGAAYRKDMVEVLVRRAMGNALDQIKKVSHA